MPSADSCGDPFLEKQLEGLLPVGCGAEAVYNFSLEKEILVYGSGDDDDDDIDYQWPTTVETIVIPTRSLLSTAAQPRTTHSTTAAMVGIVSVTPKRSAPRLPPRFTPSPESRDASFQHLLRIHLNTFNQRLSMLERNTLDMKESIHGIEGQQRHLNSHLKELIALQSAGEKNKKVSELEKSYTDMDARLSRLEGRLEILIDGFTALAQEMNKMKRVRHTSRSPQEKRALPSLATVLALPSYSTPQTPVRVIPAETSFARRAAVPKSIPTPGISVNKPTSAPHRERKVKSAATTTPVKNTTQLKSSTRSKGQLSTRSTSKSKSKSHVTVKPETKRSDSRRSAVTVKRLSLTSKTKPKQVTEETTITKFQLEPPSHKSKPAKPDQANKKDSALPIKNNGHKKVFRSDAPIPKKVQEGGKSSEGDSKKSSKIHMANSNQNGKKMEHNSLKLVSHKTKNTAKNTTTKPTKATTANKSKTTVKRKVTAPKTKVTTVKKKSTTTVKRKPTTPKIKATTAKKVTKKPQQKKKTKSQSGILDLLQLLKGNHKSAKQKKNHEGSLHVVLGRLAIPIKIIPDD